MQNSCYRILRLIVYFIEFCYVKTEQRESFFDLVWNRIWGEAPTRCGFEQIVVIFIQQMALQSAFDNDSRTFLHCWVHRFSLKLPPWNLRCIANALILRSIKRKRQVSRKNQYSDVADMLFAFQTCSHKLAEEQKNGWKLFICQDTLQPTREFKTQVAQKSSFSCTSDSKSNNLFGKILKSLSKYLFKNCLNVIFNN